jgi:hypothetical protein
MSPLSVAALNVLVRALREDRLTHQLACEHGFNGVFECVAQVMEQLGIGKVQAGDLDALLTVGYPLTDSLADLRTVVNQKATYRFSVPLAFSREQVELPVAGEEIALDLHAAPPSPSGSTEPLYWLTASGEFVADDLASARRAASEAAFVWATQLIVLGYAEDCRAFGSFNLRGGPSLDVLDAWVEREENPLSPPLRFHLQLPGPIAEHARLKRSIIRLEPRMLFPSIRWWLTARDLSDDRGVVAALRQFGLALVSTDAPSSVVTLGSCLESLFPEQDQKGITNSIRIGAQGEVGEAMSERFVQIYKARCDVVHRGRFRLSESARLRGIQDLISLIGARMRRS